MVAQLGILFEQDRMSSRLPRLSRLPVLNQETFRRGSWEVLVGLVVFQCLYLLTVRRIRYGEEEELKCGHLSAHDLCLTSFLQGDSGRYTLVTHRGWKRFLCSLFRENP